LRKKIYLEYTLQRNGGQEAHVKDRVRRTVAAMSQVWGYREEKIWGLGKKVVAI